MKPRIYAVAQMQKFEIANALQMMKSSNGLDGFPIEVWKSLVVDKAVQKDYSNYKGT